METVNLKYSVIIPLYNKAPYIRKALESVIAQTFKDFELIVVDDGSSDNSIDIVNEFFERFQISDFRFQILQQKNAGVAAARNRGVKESNGEYIAFLDADDWMHFRTFRKPLVNNHYTENYCGYRQYYYKPTAFAKDDILHLFYTANAKEDNKKNQLYHTEMPIKQLTK